MLRYTLTITDPRGWSQDYPGFSSLRDAALAVGVLLNFVIPEHIIAAKAIAETLARTPDGEPYFHASGYAFVLNEAA